MCFPRDDEPCCRLYKKQSSNTAQSTKHILQILKKLQTIKPIRRKFSKLFQADSSLLALFPIQHLLYWLPKLPDYSFVAKANKLFIEGKKKMK